MVSGAAFTSESEEFLAESLATAVLSVADEGAELSLSVVPVLLAELHAVARTPAANRQKITFFMLVGLWICLQTACRYFFLKYIRTGTPLKSKFSLSWFSR
jgi:hypothetical protein